jgi:tellurite resistance protein TerC
VNVPAWVWLITLGVFAAILFVDLRVVDSRPHVFGPREATRWVVFYICLALLFAAGLAVVVDTEHAAQFLAGYITEYSLSVDNLFVFLVIMSSFAVPAEHQHRVLLVGIVIALILRGILILFGAAVIERFAGTFYLFGLLLLYTAVTIVRERDEAPDPGANPLVRALERFVPTTREYHGTALVVRIDGVRTATPMLLVMIAIGTTDLMFALDSIPAIFGLTQEPYLVFTANAFALMGLRQLYFLLHGLLDKLVYLSIGLAVILAFIGVKLIFHAMHATGTLWADAPEITIAQSLAVIIGVLVVTTVASLIRVRTDPSRVMSRSVRAEREAMAHAGEELLRLREEVAQATRTVREHEAAGAPDHEVQAARDHVARLEQEHDEVANRLADLQDRLGPADPAQPGQDAGRGDGSAKG